MPQPDFDAIVVGGGPGGAAAAGALVAHGLRVLVVERARLPRYKSCGGAIPRAVLESFLGLPLGEVSGRAPIRAVPTEVRFTFPGLPPVDMALPDAPVAMVMRSEFDALLLSQSGAEVVDGTAVINLTETPDGVTVQVRGEASGRDLTASYLVGADGASSIVARRLGLRRTRRLGGTLEAEIPLAGRAHLEAAWAERALFSLGAVPWGYAWVFPKGDHLSVGIGRFRPGRVDLWGTLQREMDRLGIPLDGAAVHGHPIPAYQPLSAGAHGLAPRRGGRLRQEVLTTRRCVLVGDAAGMVDPLLGEGIRYALLTGRLAAEAIARGDLSGYEAAVWHEAGESLATACRVADLFYRWPRRCFLWGVRNPATVRLFVDLLAGKVSYQGIGRRLLSTTLSWLLSGPLIPDPCHFSQIPEVSHDPGSRL